MGRKGKEANLVTSRNSTEVGEVHLRSGKVLPPRPTPQDKGKKVVEECVRPPHAVSHAETPVEGHPQVDYNVLAHLRKLPAKLSIYDALVLSKEMRESLVKALVDPEVCLAQLASTDSIDSDAPSVGEDPGVTFREEDLLLGTTAHNRPLYISGDFGRFRVTRMLVDPGASASLMTLTTLIHLKIDVSRLQVERMLLKGFNQASERALGSMIPLLGISEKNPDKINPVSSFPYEAGEESLVYADPHALGVLVL